jgi:hypothetical protein
MPCSTTRYSTAQHTHALHTILIHYALLYDKPRGASVFCKEAGRLWALDRLAFRTILMKSPKKALLKTLRRVGVLKSLDTSQVQSINSILFTINPYWICIRTPWRCSLLIAY